MSKIRPYEHLHDDELVSLTVEAAALQQRMALTDPRQVQQKLVQLGCPRRDAAGMLADPRMSLGAFRVYFDWIDAQFGDREAEERIEFITASWERMRRGREVVQ